MRARVGVSGIVVDPGQVNGCSEEGGRCSGEGM